MERELSVSNYQLGILQEALALNIGKAPIPTRQTTLSRQTSNLQETPNFNSSIKIPETHTIYLETL